jgi:hypothetical protein
MSQTLIHRVFPPLCLGHGFRVLGRPGGRHVGLDVGGGRRLVGEMIGGGEGSLSNGLDDIVHDTFAARGRMKRSPSGDFGAFWDDGSGEVGDEGEGTGDGVAGCESLHGVIFQSKSRFGVLSSAKLCALSVGQGKAHLSDFGSSPINSMQSQKSLHQIWSHMR